MRQGRSVVAALALLGGLAGCSGASEEAPREPAARPTPPEESAPPKPTPPSPPPEAARDPHHERVLTVARPEPDAPLADLSHYAPRRAARAPEAQLNSGDCSSNTAFRYAAGTGDITGISSGLGMLGYADIGQVAAGIHTRQLARAFAVHSSCGGREGYAMLVSLEQGLMFQSVRQAVLDALRDDVEDDLGTWYHAGNVMMTATHTHASAGGQAHHDLYNITTLGHDTASFEAIVAGTVEAIRRAHRGLRKAAPGPIRFAQGELLNALVQRSAPAYANNPADERARFVDTQGREVSVNRMMTLLRLSRDDGTDAGMLNWFAIHGTSMAQTNQLLSGDNKGYAALRFERDFGADYGAGTGFVAGFFQADEGDNSPNIFITELEERELRDLEGAAFRGRGGGEDDFDSTLISGYKQYHKARQLWEDAEEKLRGEVASAQIYIDFSRVEVAPARVYPERWAPARGRGETCQPALGVSFAAGAEDGRGPFSEGQACPIDPFSLTSVVAQLNGAWTAITQGALPSQLAVPIGCGNPAFGLLGYHCHAEKPVVVPLAISPFLPTQGLAPSKLPLQIITLGNFAIVALPWEVTTTSGRRLREAVLDVLEDSGVDYAVISGLSNGYIHYLTTREEYASQQYEGGSTVFGPWAQEAVEQELVRLAGHLRMRTRPDSPFAAADYRSRRTLFVRYPTGGDGDTGKRSFGDVVVQPHPEYRLAAAGPVISASFIAGHPRRDLRRGSGYGFIERLQGKRWVTVANDFDWETRFHYRLRAEDGANHAIIEWHPRPDTPPGTYRIRHRGAHRRGSYEGVSQPFELRR